MLQDTHTHLYLPEFDSDRENLIKKALSLGVEKFYLPNVDSSTINSMLELESKYKNSCFAMIGLHPCSVNQTVKDELQIVHNWLSKRKFIAIGEIGIDLYWDKSFLKEQIVAFEQQINWALEFKYPIVIHCRNAFNETYNILKAYRQLPKAIFHCFSGTLDEANKIIELGDFKLGIGGVITFKNAGLDKVVEQIDLKHLVLETDAPYLAPVPYRGKRNEPVYIFEVAKKIAQLKNCSFDEVAKMTKNNSEFIFNAQLFDTRE
ncbi:MAG: TatD family hydrolase [Bacteroidetes bacterium]|nr:TatD family hydrolase [Bacteroidota bacterium]